MILQLKKTRVYIVVYCLLILHFIIVSCSSQTSNESLGKDEFSGDEFWFIDTEDRVKITSEVYDTIEARYAPLKLKERRFNFSIEALKNAALQEEEEATYTANPILKSEKERAESNLAFFDRMRKRIADFRDTHFTLNPILPLPNIKLPISIKKIDSRYYLIGFSEDLKELLKSKQVENIEKLELGLEIMEINNINIKVYADEIEGFVSASSDSFASLRAAKYLTARNFKYPKQPNELVTFKDTTGFIFDLEIPWYHLYKAGQRRDAAYYLKELQIPSLGDLLAEHEKTVGAKAKYNYAINKGNDDEVASLTYNIRETYNLGPEKIIELGDWEHGNTKYQIISLYSFTSNKLKNKNGKEINNSLEAIKPFVKRANENGQPIILDLRQNGGGSPNLANNLFSLFLAKDQVVGSATLAHRVTRQIRQVMEAQNLDLIIEDFNSESINALQQAILSKSDYSQPYEELLIKADDQISGFNSKLIILSSPFCISACDRAMAYFKHYGVGTIIGQPTNGTGAGFSWLGEKKTFEWSDTFFVFQSFFPNRLFGRPLDQNSENDVFSSNLENRPTTPHVNFNESLEHSIGTAKEDPWLLKAAEMLD